MRCYNIRVYIMLNILYSTHIVTYITLSTLNEEQLPLSSRDELIKLLQTVGKYLLNIGDIRIKYIPNDFPSLLLEDI